MIRQLIARMFGLDRCTWCFRRPMTLQEFDIRPGATFQIYTCPHCGTERHVFKKAK